MAKLKTIALTLSGLSAVSGAAAAQNATPNQTGMAMMRLNSALLDQAKVKTFGSGSLWASLKKDFRMSEVNSELVRRHESKFAANGAYFVVGELQPAPRGRNPACPAKLGKRLENRRFIIFHPFRPRQSDRADRSSEKRGDSV